MTSYSYVIFSNKHNGEHSHSAVTNEQKALERDQINPGRSRFRHGRRRQPRGEIRERTILVRSYVILEIERVAQRIVAEIHRIALVVMSEVVVVARDLDACLDAATTFSELELLRRGFEPLVRRSRCSRSDHRFGLNHRVGS